MIDMSFSHFIKEVGIELGLITDRFKRQKAFIGEPGQQRLFRDICIVGMGGLGTSTADMLARSGIKSMKIIDADIVEYSNLQRQTLYSETDVGKKKIVAAKDRLQLINSSIDVIAVDQMLTSSNLNIMDSSLVLDCTDNLQARFLINKHCIAKRIPWIFASVAGDHGMIKVIRPGTACLRCFIHDNSQAETAAKIGVLNSAVQVASSIQVSLAMQLLLDETPEERLITFDVWNSILQKTEVKKNMRCPVCRESY